MDNEDAELRRLLAEFPGDAVATAAKPEKSASRRSAKRSRAELAAPVAPAAPAPEREYSWCDWASGWTEGRIGYERQQAARAQAAAPKPLPEPHGPPAPMPKNYDPHVNGLWRGEPKLIARVSDTPAPVVAPVASPTRADLDRSVDPDGNISMRPRGGWGFP